MNPEVAAYAKARNEMKVLQAIGEGMTHLTTIQHRTGMARMTAYRTLRELCDESSGVLEVFSDYRGRNVYRWKA